MTYDGHGRMKTRHYPIEDTATETTWNYNADDSVSQIVDPRGAVTDIAYDTRGLTTQVGYTPPTGTAVPDTPTTNFTYDNAGNRTSMDTAGVSETTYAYDELSRLTSETVDFDDLTSNYSIGYGYEVSGKLKSITDPFGYQVEYANDAAGRLTAVTGDSTGSNTTGEYASGIKYRAFGQVKEMRYDLPAGDAVIRVEYDEALRAVHSEASAAGSTSSYLLSADYSYYADGRLEAKDDLLDDKWDRTNRYDHAGRLVFGQFGLSGVHRVYEQTVTYDAFSQTTQRSTTYWGGSGGYGAGYTNGRKTSGSGNPPDYDAAGNVVEERTNYRNRQWTTYDAAGRRVDFTDRWQVSMWASQDDETRTAYDGDGRPVIEKQGSKASSSQTPITLAVMGYRVWSNVLGKSLTTVSYNESKLKTMVYAGGALIATQVTSTMSDNVVFHTADPVRGTRGRFIRAIDFAIKDERSVGNSIKAQDEHRPHE